MLTIASVRQMDCFHVKTTSAVLSHAQHMRFQCIFVFVCHSVCNISYFKRIAAQCEKQYYACNVVRSLHEFVCQNITCQGTGIAESVGTPDIFSENRVFLPENCCSYTCFVMHFYLFVCWTITNKNKKHKKNTTFICNTKLFKKGPD